MWTPREGRTSESGFSALWIIAILAAAGVIAGALLQLGPIGMRTATVNRARVQALDHAESGVAFALARLQEVGFDLDRFGSLDAEEWLLSDGGGFREVEVDGTNGEYRVRVTGFQRGANGRETTRRVEVVLGTSTVTAGGLFPTYLVDLSKDPYDRNHPAYGYERIDFFVPDMSRWPIPGVDVGSRTVKVISDNFSGSDRFDADIIYIGKGLNLNGPRLTLTVPDGTTIYVNGDFKIGNNITLDFLGGATIYVGGNVDIDGTIRNSGPQALDAPWVVFYVNGELTMGGNSHVGSPYPSTVFLMTSSGSGRVHLHGKQTFYGGIYAPTREVKVSGTPSQTLGGAIVSPTEPDFAGPPGHGESVLRNAFVGEFADRLRSFHLKDPTSRIGDVFVLRWQEVPAN